MRVCVAHSGGADQQQRQMTRRQVIVQRDEKGYGFTVQGANPVFIHTVKESTAAFCLGVQIDQYNILRRNVLQCAAMSHCYTSFSNFVRLSVRLSVTRRYCVRTTARSTVQFALSDSKMCLVF